MKIAFCIAGHVRRYEKAFVNFQQKFLNPLRKKHEVDLFLSVWDKRVENSSHGWQAGAYRDLESLSVNVDELFSLYQPKSMVVDNYDKLKHLFLLSNFTNKRSNDIRYVVDGIWHPASAHYRRLQCSLLKQDYEINNGFKYDLVLQWRPDLIIKNEINLNRLENFNPNVLHLHSASLQWDGHFWAGDCYAYGSSALTDELFQCFNYLKETANMFGDPDNFQSERTLYNYLSYKKVPISESFLIEWEVLR